MTEIFLDQNWQQIQPQRDVSAANFTSGSILLKLCDWIEWCIHEG